MRIVTNAKDVDYVCTEVHEKACKYCPSKFENDPEVEQILKLNREERMSTIFACGWRPTKYCKAYFDKMSALEA